VAKFWRRIIDKIALKINV